MLMSEWPKAGDRGPTNWARFRAAWSQLGAGLLTFFLSGLLGLILMYRNFVPVSAAFVNLLPAFIGLFAIPMVLTNLIMGTRVPPQHISTSIDAAAFPVVARRLRRIVGWIVRRVLPGGDRRHRRVSGGACHGAARRAILHRVAGRVEVGVLRGRLPAVLSAGPAVWRAADWLRWSAPSTRRARRRCITWR